jgi:hypothetical protein
MSVKLTAAVFAAALSSVAYGQQPQKVVLPTEMIPPPGMCRIWIKNVPARQQPAPTDCATAARSKPANADLIYGDDYVRRNPVARGSATTVPTRAGSPTQSVAPRNVVAPPPTPPTPPKTVPKPGGGSGQ